MYSIILLCSIYVIIYTLCKIDKHSIESSIEQEYHHKSYTLYLWCITCMHVYMTAPFVTSRDIELRLRDDVWLICRMFLVCIRTKNY